MWGVYGDTSQDTIQTWFFVIAVICVPLMLLPKPLYLIYCGSQEKKIKEEDDNGRLLSSGDSLDHADSSICGCM